MVYFYEKRVIQTSEDFSKHFPRAWLTLKKRALMYKMTRDVRLPFDAMVWTLVHSNTPGSVDESADELKERLERMRLSAGSYDAMEYWGTRLLRQHECAEMPLDACALAFAMSQHPVLGVASSAAGLKADILESIFEVLRVEAVAFATRTREARSALWAYCITPWPTLVSRARAEMRVVHFLEARAADQAHFARTHAAFAEGRGECGCKRCVSVRHSMSVRPQLVQCFAKA